jgi:predicted transcriptional regulator
MLGRVDGLAKVERGKIATDEEVVAKFRKCRTPSA